MNCVICQRITSPTPLQAQCLIWQDEYFLLRHSEETNIPGYLLIESREHVLDLSYLADHEGKHFGALLQKAQRLLRQVLIPPPLRLYTFSLAEACPHFHLHLIPRSENFPAAFTGRGIMSYPLQPACSEEERLELCKVLQEEWSKKFV